MTNMMTMKLDRDGEMDAKAEAKKLLRYLFRVPEDYSATTIDRFVDLISRAAVEEIEEGARKDE